MFYALIKRSELVHWTCSLNLLLESYWKLLVECIFSKSSVRLTTLLSLIHGIGRGRVLYFWVQKFNVYIFGLEYEMLELVPLPIPNCTFLIPWDHWSRLIDHKTYLITFKFNELLRPTSMFIELVSLRSNKQVQWTSSVRLVSAIDVNSRLEIN